MSHSSKNNMKLVINEYKEAVIIGNGPSGICASYFLSGHWPYWNKNKVSDEYLQLRLDSIDSSKSLVEQDLEFLSDGLDGRSRNPVALLYDYLNNPDSDYGLNTPSCIEWKYDPKREIDHVVIGKSDKPGGAWNSFAGNHLTVSLSKWMELPEMTFEDYETDVENKTKYDKKLNGRVTANEVRDYYQYYVKKKHLDKYMLNNATVTSVKQKSIELADKKENDSLEWEVFGFIDSITNCASGKIKHEKYEFRLICKYLILAIGTTDIHNELRVPGEHLNYILRSIRELEEKIKKNLKKLRKHPLLVVGCGLSAADCILIANKHRIKIVHVMRSSVYDTKNVVYSKLPKSDYPEYHKVYEQMLTSKKNQNMQTNDSIDSTSVNDDYILYDEHTIKLFASSSRTCILRGVRSGIEKEIRISYACVLIGHSANLNFFPSQIRNNLAINQSKPINSKDNPIEVDPFTLETSGYKNLFGMGPIVGDSFVRYGTAGSLGIMNHIWKTSNHSN